MDNFLKWFFAFISEMLQGFALIFTGLWKGIIQIFNIGRYVELFKEYSVGFGPFEWILSILAILLVIAVFALFIFIIVLVIRKYLRFRHSIVSNEDLLEEISVLQQRVIKMVKEKDEIMAIKVAQMGLPSSGSLPAAAGQLAADGTAAEGGELQAQPVDAGILQTSERRFSKLMEVDSFYSSFLPPEYDDKLTLPDIVERYRNFACSRMHLYYDQKTIRLFIAGMASTKLIILQGISGTGKTSPPIHSVSFCRMTLPSLLYSLHGVTVQSFSVTSTNLPRISTKLRSSNASMLPATTMTSTSFFSMR